MPSLRTRSVDQLDNARLAVAKLSAQLDDVDLAPSGSGYVQLSMGGSSPLARLVAREAVSESDVRHLRSSRPRTRVFVVANRISEEARALLSSYGWSWLDRRVGAHIDNGDRVVDVVYLDRPAAAAGSAGPARTARPSSDGPIRGRAGISYASAVLCRPDDPPSLRSVATAIGMSPTSVSNAARLLAAEGLLEPEGLPACPDLFDALAAVWGPVAVAGGATVPDPEDPGLSGYDADLAHRGWALGGDLAALELGAPIFTTDARPTLWVPSLVDLRRAERYLGPASWDDRAATLLVAPTPLVCQNRHAPGPSGWPLAHPVFAALDLAQDRGRGREVLGGWQPEGIRVVWR